MNEVQELLVALREKGWTLAAIADEVQVAHVTVEKWNKGERTPANKKVMLLALEGLKTQQPPKRRRYGNQQP